MLINICWILNIGGDKADYYYFSSEKFTSYII